MANTESANSYESKVVLHHVGGRWGNRSFPQLPQFERDFVNVLYEADSDALDGIRKANRDSKADLIIIEACLAEADVEKKLYVMMNPGATSTLKPGIAWNDRYNALFGIDFDYPNGSKIVETRRLNAQSMDSLLANARHDRPLPDFLSLDTQGSEYEILCGAQQTLQHVCGLIVEVEFVRLYRDQKRFQDICDLLEKAGFSFVRFQSIGELYGPRAALGFRGLGYQTWADAIFIRRTESFGLTSAIEKKNLIRIRKLCFIAVVFGLLEQVINYFERFGGAGFADPISPECPRRYEVFLSELFNAYQRDIKIFPPLFSEILPIARAREFAAATPERWPALLDLENYTNAGYVGALLDSQRNTDTEVESVLRKFNFDDLANRVAMMRRDQASKVQIMIEQFQSFKLSSRKTGQL